MNEAEKNEYEKLCKEFDKRFSEVVEEFNEAVKRLGKETDLTRIRLLLAFSFLEIICKVYNRYYDLKLGNKALLEKWIKDYCLASKNSFYTSHPYLNRTTETHLYQFRCSIVHAFTMPAPESGTSIAVPNGDDTAPNIEAWDARLTGAGHRVAFISAGSLMKLFIKGAETLLHEMIVPPVSATTDNLAGMRRVANWLEVESARHVDIT